MKNHSLHVKKKKFQVKLKSFYDGGVKKKCNKQLSKCSMWVPGWFFIHEREQAWPTCYVSKLSESSENSKVVRNHGRNRESEGVRSRGVGARNLP